MNGVAPPNEQETGQPKQVDIFSIAEQNPAIAITFLLVTISLMGVSYSRSLFGGFETSYLELADTKDFLIAGIRRPLMVAALFAIMAALLAKLYKMRTLISMTHYAAAAIIYITLTALVPGFVGYADASKIKRGTDVIYQLFLDRNNSSESSLLSTAEVALIGRVGIFIVFFEQKTCGILIIQQSDIKTLRLVSDEDEGLWAYTHRWLTGKEKPCPVSARPPS